MLAMVVAVFELRRGLGMPKTTSELYQTAADTMLERGGVAAEELRRFIQLGLAKLVKLAIKFFAKFAKICNFLAGSFSAVSKRNFARKYAFDSIFPALRDLHTSAPLQSQLFRKK